MNNFLENLYKIIYILYIKYIESNYWKSRKFKRTQISEISDSHYEYKNVCDGGTA